MATLLYAPSKVPVDEIVCAQGTGNCRDQRYESQSEIYQRARFDIDNDDDVDGEDDCNDGDNLDCDDVSDSLIYSDRSDETLDEIPVWIRGEPRWISGLTKDTTCEQIVEALLREERIDIDMTDTANQYVITERWRQVEQILDNSTKVLNIWTAWGETQSEVRLSLRRIGFSPNTPTTREMRLTTTESIDGRYSPSQLNNAAMKRKRQRSSKLISISTLQHNQQDQHKSSTRPTIEKLMQLILEQGETIQQQLTELRNREHQIADIEKFTYQRQPGRNGKNYLLETYLNGIRTSVDNEKEITTGTSDSGVHTGEDVTTTPELGISSVHQSSDAIDATIFNEDGDAKETIYHQHNLDNIGAAKRKPTVSKREYELIREHEYSKDFILKYNSDVILFDDDGIEEDDLSRHILLLQKLISLNKHLQREEELIVRLMAKIRKYECTLPDMTEVEVKEAINQINFNIQRTSNEMKFLEDEIQSSANQLVEKSEIVDRLNEELKALELKENPLINIEPQITDKCLAISSELLEISCNANSSYPLGTLMQMNPYTNGEEIVLNQSPSFFHKEDFPIASVNLHADQRHEASPLTYGLGSKLGPKKFIAGYIRDPDSDTGISSLEDNTLLGTLV